MNPKYLSSIILYTTVLLVVYHTDNSLSWGTAFMFNYAVSDSQHIPVLITNKHVIRGGVNGRFRLHTAVLDSAGARVPTEKNMDVEFLNFNSRWVSHPDSSIDLCAYAINRDIFVAESRSGNLAYYVPFDETTIPTDSVLSSLHALEDIIMVGYPLALSDTLHNYPVYRKGITASPASLNFNGRSEGLVDIATWYGSSGSPLLIMNEGSYNAGNDLMLGTRFMLLGVIYATYLYDINGAVTNIEIPTSRMGGPTMSVPANIGIYIHAKEILTLKRELFKTFNLPIQ